MAEKLGKLVKPGGLVVVDRNPYRDVGENGQIRWGTTIVDAVVGIPLSRYPECVAEMKGWEVVDTPTSKVELRGSDDPLLVVGVKGDIF